MYLTENEIRFKIVKEAVNDAEFVMGPLSAADYKLLKVVSLTGRYRKRHQKRLNRIKHKYLQFKRQREWIRQKNKI